MRHPLRSTLFPYTTLFRSEGLPARHREPGRQALQEAGIHDVSGSVTAASEPSKTHKYEPVIRKQSRTRDRSSLDRKSTRLNSSHMSISYAVFCLKKKILRT